MPVLINQGTQTTIAAIENAGTQYPYVKLDAGVGSAVLDWGGTIPTVSNLTNGTVRVSVGTVTQNAVPLVIGTSYGTLGTAGAATWGTLVATAGAGTRQYVSGIAIVVASGTVDCAITNVGTVAAANGAGILARGQFVPGGGIMRDFFPAQVSGTNGTLSFWLGGAGTAYFIVDYWQGV